MDKSPDAFRTISEVAETLDTPAHVLRFWESRFPQIRPVKRAGGRRYYRPADVALLTGIKRLLHDEGLTIRGVQKILREQGVRHVARLAGAAEADLAPFDPALALEEAMAERFSAQSGRDAPIAEVETAQIFALEAALRPPAAKKSAPEPDLLDLMAEAADPLADVAEPVAVEPGVPEPEIAEPEFAEPETAAPALAEPELAEAEAVVDPMATEPDLPEPDLPEPDAAELHDAEPQPMQPAAAAPPAAPEIAVPAPPQPQDASPAASRAAMLRALPRPPGDALRVQLGPLRDQIAAHRDRLAEAQHSAGRRG